jgi:hypothetical protein
MERLSFIAAWLLFMLSLPVTAGMPVHGVSLGILHHDTPDLWSGISRESGFDVNAEVTFEPALPLWGGSVRPAMGISVNSVGDTSKIYADARWEFDLSSRVYGVLGVGVAVHDGERDLVRDERKALGSSILFHFPIELGYRLDPAWSVSAYFDHVSNAWLADPNEGMDTLGLRLSYRF